MRRAVSSHPLNIEYSDGTKISITGCTLNSDENFEGFGFAICTDNSEKRIFRKGHFEASKLTGFSEETTIETKGDFKIYSESGTFFIFDSTYTDVQHQKREIFFDGFTQRGPTYKINNRGVLESMVSYDVKFNQKNRQKNRILDQRTNQAASSKGIENENSEKNSQNIDRLLAEEIKVQQDLLIKKINQRNRIQQGQEAKNMKQVQINSASREQDELDEAKFEEEQRVLDQVEKERDQFTQKVLKKLEKQNKKSSDRDQCHLKNQSSIGKKLLNLEMLQNSIIMYMRFLTNPA